MSLRRHALSMLLALTTAAACGSSEGAGTPDVVLKSNLRVLDAASLAKIESISVMGTITFAGHDAKIDALAAGDVLAGAIAPATPNGILRNVSKVTKSDAGVVVETRPAVVTDAIERATIHATKALATSDLAPAVVTPGVAGFYVGLDEEVLYDGGSVDARVTASGSISLEPSIDLDLDIGWDGLHKAAFTVSGTEAATIALTGGAGLHFDETKDVYTYRFVPWVIYVAEFPIVVTPRLILRIGASGSFEAKTTVSAVQQAHARVGLGWEDGTFGPIAEVTPTFSSGPPLASANATVKAWAGARAEIFVYGSSGPYGTLDGYVRLGADTNATPCWHVDVGVESDIGLVLGVFGLDLVDKSVKVLDQSKTLASGDCGANPTAPAPWSYVYKRVGGDSANAVDAMPDGGLVIAGDASADASVTRLAADGSILWQKAYPTGWVAHAVKGTAAAVFVGGSAWVAKLDAKTGAVLWSYTYGSGPEVKAIDATADGGCIVAGLTTSPTNDFDYWWMKLDASGAVTWAKRMGDAKWEEVHAVRALAGGGYVLVGQYAPNQDADAFFARLDDNGAVTAQKKYAGVGSFEAFDALTPVSDGFVVVGRAQRPAGGAGWAAKLDATGGVVWSKAFGETSADYLYAVTPITTGFLATGTSGILQQKAWAVALDVTGHPIWSRTYGAADATKDVQGRGLALFADGAFTFGGVTNAFDDANLVAHHVGFDGTIDFAATSGMVLATGSGTSETPFAAPVVTTSYVPVAIAVTPAAKAVTPLPLAAVATKLSK